MNFKFGSETNFGHIHLAADRWEKGVVDVEGVWRQYEGPKTLQGGGDTIDQSNSKKIKTGEMFSWCCLLKKWLCAAACLNIFQSVLLSSCKKYLELML